MHHWKEVELQAAVKRACESVGLDMLETSYNDFVQTIEEVASLAATGELPAKFTLANIQE